MRDGELSACGARAEAMAGAMGRKGGWVEGLACWT